MTMKPFRYRFLQTGDLHIGRGRSTWGEEVTLRRAERLLDCLGETAKREKCHGILITGDVFDTKSVTNREREVLISKLVGMAGKDGLPVYIIPGNHDLTKLDAANTDFLAALADTGEIPKLHVAPANEFRIWSTTYPTLKVAGLPVGMSENQAYVESFCQSLPKDCEYIVMGHGTIGGCVRNDFGWKPSEAEDAQRLNLRVAALSAPQVIWWAYGDIHKRQTLPSLPEGHHGGYAGSPIQQDFGEQPDRGVLVVALDCKPVGANAKWGYVGRRYVRIDEPSAGFDPLVDVLQEHAIDDLPPNALIRLARGLVLSEDRHAQIVRDHRVVYDHSTVTRKAKNSEASNIKVVDGRAMLQVFDPLMSDLSVVEDEVLRDMPTSVHPVVTEEARKVVGLAVERFRNRSYVS